jgi:oligoendopeptidase F
MRSQPLVWNHFSATEFVEVPSQAMEVLALPLLHRDRGGFYAEDELQRVTQIQIATIVHLLTWIGFMDSMQHWMYAEVAPGQLTIADIDAKAVETLRRFMPQTDWSGCEREQSKVWHYHHIFTAPFYYIEYGLAWLGALQIWRNSLQDRDRTVGQYRAALTLGNSRSVPELFAAAGAKFAFDRETLRELIGFLREQRSRPIDATA